jgi:hypothetical protein
MKILKKDLRRDLNKLVPELEINEEHTIEWLKRVYFSKLEPAEQIRQVYRWACLEVATQRGVVSARGVERILAPGG